MNGLLDPQPRRFGQHPERTINLLASHPPHPNRHRLTALELIAHADTLSVADMRRAAALGARCALQSVAARRGSIASRREPGGREGLGLAASADHGYL